MVPGRNGREHRVQEEAEVIYHSGDAEGDVEGRAALHKPEVGEDVRIITLEHLGAARMLEGGRLGN